MGSLAGNNLGTGAVDCATYSTPGGNTDLDGTAPGAKIIAQEAGNSLQYLNNLGGTLYHAANTAFQNGARIHSNSWGSSCRNSFGACISGCTVDYRATSRDGDQVVWDHPELAVFVAAGNSGGALVMPAADRAPTSARREMPRTSSRSAAIFAVRPGIACPASPRADPPRIAEPSRI